MIHWKIAPGFYKAAGEAFMNEGAALPKKLKMLGRWHGPGSALGWALVEGEDLKPLYEHIAKWADVIEFQVTPVMDEADAVEALSNFVENRGY